MPPISKITVASLALFYLMNNNPFNTDRLFNKKTSENKRSTVSLTETVQRESVNLGSLLFAAEEAGIPERMYRVIFPFKEPANTIERRLLEEIGDVEYMKLVRIHNGVDLAVSLATSLNQTFALGFGDVYLKNIELRRLTPYIHEDDINIYQASRSNYQGTHVPARALAFQETLTGRLIPIGVPKSIITDTSESVVAAQENMSNISQGIDAPSSKVVFDLKKRGSKDIYLANIATREVIQLTDDKFNNRDGALSYDGSMVTFVSNRGGNYDIWILEIATGKIIKLTNSNIEETGPSWSKDGKKIVFRAEGQSVYRMNLERDECNLKLAKTSVGFGQSFSPDGAQIIYSAGHQFIGFNNSNGGYSHTIPEKSYFKAPDWQRGFTQPDWSISGKIVSILHESSREESTAYNGLVVMNSDESNIQKFFWEEIFYNRGYFPGFELIYRKPSWSQDGKYIFYYEGRKGFVLDPESGNTIDIKTFKSTSIDILLTEVSLDELMSIEKTGKKYNTPEETVGALFDALKRGDLEAYYNLACGDVMGVRRLLRKYGADETEERLRKNSENMTLDIRYKDTDITQHMDDSKMDIIPPWHIDQSRYEIATVLVNLTKGGRSKVLTFELIELDTGWRVMNYED